MFKISQAILDEKTNKIKNLCQIPVLYKNFRLALFFFPVILKNTMDILVLTTQRTKNI